MFRFLFLLNLICLITLSYPELSDEDRKRSARFLEACTAFVELASDDMSHLLPQLGIIEKHPEQETLELWELMARRYAMFNNAAASKIEDLKIAGQKVTALEWYGAAFELVDCVKENQLRFKTFALEHDVFSDGDSRSIFVTSLRAFNDPTSKTELTREKFSRLLQAIPAVENILRPGGATKESRATFDIAQEMKETNTVSLRVSAAFEGSDANREVLAKMEQEYFARLRAQKSKIAARAVPLINEILKELEKKPKPHEKMIAELKADLLELK